MAKKIIWSSLLLMVVLTASIYFVFNNGNSQFKVDIQNTRTQYYVNESGWVLSATEYVNLYDGSSKMLAKSRNLTWFNDSQYVYAVRTSTWKENISTIQIYKFKINEDNVENVPIENSFQCINCQGKIVHYEIKDILYEGVTKEISSPFNFGHNMNIEWNNNSDFMWAKVYQQKTNDKIVIRFKPDTQNEIYNVRLSDPVANWTTSELIAYYALNETSGNVTDATKKQANGTLTGNITQGVSGKINNSYFFPDDDTDSYINLTWGKNTTVGNFQSFSVAAWINVTDTTDATNIIGSRGTTYNSFITLGSGNQSPGSSLVGIGGVTLNQVISKNTWNFVAMTYNGSALSFYLLNSTGYYNKTTTGLYGTINLTSDILVGFDATTPDPIRRYVGRIDEISFWNTSLSQNEISKFYANNLGCHYGNETCISDDAISSTVILNSPSNNSFILATSVLLNVTITDPDSSNFNVIFVNNSDHSIICSNSSITNNSVVLCTWLGLQNLMNYTWYVNATGGIYTNKSNIWKLNVGDIVNPVINFTNPTPINNTQNISSRNFIFINTSVIEVQPKNITYNLYYANGTLFNKTTFNMATNTSNTTMNLSGLNDGSYLFNVTIFDNFNNSNSTETRMYHISTLNSFVNSLSGNINAELGGPYNLIANSTAPNSTLCVDINHTEFGINYSSGVGSINLNFTIDYFRKTSFSNGNSNQTLYYNETNTSQSTFNVHNFSFPVHQYDYVDGLSVNLSGDLNEGNSSIYEPQIIIYKSDNSSEIDRAFYGELVNGKVYLNKVFDNNNGTELYLNTTNVSFENYGDQLVYLYVDRNASIESFLLNITGFNYGFNYSNEFNNNSDFDTILTTARRDYSNSTMFKGTNLKNKIYDDFEDSSFNITKFDKTDDFTIAPGDYTLSFAVTEGNNATQLVHSWTCSSSNPYNFNSGDYGINPNITQFNLRDSQNIILNLSSSYSSSAEPGSCDGYAGINLGGTNIWLSYREQDPDSGQGLGDDVESSTANLIFNMTKLESGQWEVKISGVETSSYFDTSGCGTVTGTYNWTNGSYNNDGGTCADTNGLLDNTFNININYSSVEPIYIYNHITGTNSECESNSVTTQIYYINNSIYSIENSTLISESIFDSSADINVVTFTVNTYSWGTPPDSLYYYLSADNGENWESATSGSEHSFINQGKNIKFRIDFNTTQIGYRDNTAWLESLIINNSQSYPANVSLDFGNDGTYDYTSSGYINDTNGSITANLSSSVISNAFTGSPEVGQTWLIPLRVFSNTAGIVKIDAINLTYNPNPVGLNITSIKEYLKRLNNFGFLNISIGSINGTLNLTDLRYDYSGGNKTYEILAHNPDYTINDSINLTYYFSQWDYEFGPDVDFILFSPKNSTAKSVQPYGQTSSTPIINITNLGYGGKNATLSIYVNDSLACVNQTLSFTNNKSAGFYIGEYWTNLTNTTYLETKNIYLWSDYSCSYNNWTLFRPSYYFRMSCDGCVSSEEII